MNRSKISNIKDGLKSAKDDYGLLSQECFNTLIDRAEAGEIDYVTVGQETLSIRYVTKSI